MSPVHSPDTLLAEKIFKIALSRTVSEINVFCTLRRKFKIADKSGGKVIFAKSHHYNLDTLGVENFDEIALFRTVKEIEANLCFSIFGKNSK